MNPDDNQAGETLILVVLGDINVGKTSLMLRFTDGTFSDSVVPTVGVEYKCRTVGSRGRSINLEIRDTAGQERFRSLTGSIFRGANGVFIAYDVTEEESFLNVKTWLQETERYANREIFKLLVGTKCDLVSRRAVEYETAKELADDVQISFLETSAKNGTNVDKAFETMVAGIIHETRGPDPTGPTIRLTSSVQPARQGKKSRCC